MGGTEVLQGYIKEQDPSNLYCKICGRKIFKKDELRDVHYEMIEPGKPYEYVEEEDQILFHSPGYGGCGKESLILIGYLKNRKRSRPRTKRAVVPSENSTSDEDDLSLLSPPKKLKSSPGRIPIIVIKYMASRSIDVYTRAVVRESMYNTFIVDFGTLHRREMIHSREVPLVTLKNGPKHVKSGLIFPEGWKTLTFTKEYIYETEIVYEDDRYGQPLYKLRVYSKDESTNFDLIVQNEIGYSTANDAIKAFRKKLEVYPSYPKVVAAIEYDGVKKAIVDHFKSLVGGCSHLYDKKWLDDL